MGVARACRREVWGTGGCLLLYLLVRGSAWEGCLGGGAGRVWTSPPERREDIELEARGGGAEESTVRLRKKRRDI